MGKLMYHSIAEQGRVYLSDLNDAECDYVFSDTLPGQGSLACVLWLRRHVVLGRL